MKRHLPILMLVLTVIAVQLATKATGTAFYLTQLTMTAYYSLLIAGLCLVMGYAGQISLGHAGFFAIGGYISASLTSRDLSPFQNNSLLKLAGSLGLMQQDTGLMGESIIHLSPWAACAAAILVTVAVAYAIGIPVLKLKGHYLAMATLGFGIIVYRLVLASKFLGEADGISEVPGFPLLPGLTVSGDFSARVTNYYIAWGMVALTMWLIGNLINSRVGRALRAIHGAEEATNAMGVDTSRYKLNTFVISAVLAAVAGIFLTHYNGGIGPSEAGVMKSVRYVAIVAIGGMASLWGALTMGVVLNFLSLRGMFGTYDDAVFGVILIVIMLFAPHGLLRLPVFASLKKLFRRGEP
ncbi:MAG: branched-chain amino acid ABC transporter permease [Thermodesulfobacteriota bacterium]